MISHHKIAQQFSENKTVPGISNFTWLFVPISNVISEILSTENDVKAQILSLCQRLIKKESSGKREHVLLNNLFSTTVQYWPFFPLWLRFPQWSVTVVWHNCLCLFKSFCHCPFCVWCLQVSAKVYLPISREMVSAPIGFFCCCCCLKIYWSYYAPPHWKSWRYTQQVPKAIQSPEAGCVLCWGEWIPYVLARSYTCALNTHKCSEDTVFQL